MAQQKADKVRDHCHFTVKYHGAAYYKCNQQLEPKLTSFICHNLANYDSHLFVENLALSKGNIKYIPSNEEKYFNFGKDVIANFRYQDGREIKVGNELHFIDRFKFMPSFLNKLASHLSLEKLKKT